MTNVDITDSKIAHKSKKKSRTQALTESLLRDRAERAARKAVRSITKIERGDFDAFEATRWRVIAGRNPGYLVATPMRRRSVGWFVACDHCGAEFESKGWKYCSACMDLPAEERRSKPAPSDRPCQRCGRPIPLRRRADAKYNSEKCAKAAEKPRIQGGYARNSSTKSRVEKRPHWTERLADQPRRRRPPSRRPPSPSRQGGAINVIVLRRPKQFDWRAKRRRTRRFIFFRCFQQRLVLIGRFLTSAHSGRVLIGW